MRENIKVILLTVLTLSVFTLTIVELTGISSTAIFNKRPTGAALVNKQAPPANMPMDPESGRMKEIRDMPKTKMEFYETKFDFGKAKEGDVLTHVYRFKNTGNAPLMIAKTDVSCGCTVPEFSKEPIAPGKDGSIKVTFNSKGKSGLQQKNIIVHSNAELEAMSIGFTADIK